MINKRSFLGIPLARRSARRWLVVGFWVLILAFAVYFPLLLRMRPTFFGLPANWAFQFALLLISLLGGHDRRGLVRDFHGRTPEEGPADYSFMTPDDIAARKEAESQNRLDERDVRLRNAAHYRAYAAVRWIAFLVVFAAMTDPSLDFARLRQSLVLLLFLIIQTLPQSILLWTEPDMEEPQ